MAKTTRRERRKRAIASKSAEARGVSKIKAKHRATSSSGQHTSSKAKAAPGRLVGKDGKHLVKRPAARGQQDTRKTAQKYSPGREEGGRKKKRPRCQVGEEEVEEDDAQPVVVDELVATIQEHDQFFTRMLDMIPQHLVLPAKEVTESSYASKYMKNKKGEAPQQSKKEESKKNKRARYAADNQKTILERQQDRAKAEEGGQGDDDSDGDGDSDADGDEGLEAAAEQDGLQSEVLKGKSMDVASMDALKKRIEERIKNFQEKRTAAEGSRRAKTAAKRSAQNAAKRENKRKGIKAKKKGREGAIAAAAAKGAAANGSAEGANGANKAKDQDASSNKTKKGNKAKANGSDTQLANPELGLPPLPTVEDVGDIEFSGLRGVVGDGNGGSRGKHGLPKVGAPGSKMKRLHNLLKAAEEKKQRLTDLRQTEEGKQQAKKEGWEDAIRVAGGAEVKDNPAALKKMIKRKEKDKAKSAAKWSDRVAGQKKEQSKRQEKREENLNRRKKGGAGTTAEAERKAGDAGAGEGGGKRQRRAGFEGKKQDFINKERPNNNKAGAQDGGGGRGGGGGGRGGRGRDGGGRGRGGGGRGGGGRGGRG